jgi:hypothetical protein
MRRAYPRKVSAELGGAGISLQGVLTGDLDRLLAAEISAAHGPADGVTSAGTWQPAPPGSAPGPGTYATPVAFRLAGGHAARAVRIAMTLAAALRRASWVESATVFDGYLTVTVTRDALAALAVRITEAGSACARSTALAGPGHGRGLGAGAAAAVGLHRGPACRGRRRAHPDVAPCSTPFRASSRPGVGAIK